MSVEKREFFGKEVTDAIKEACEVLNVSQEMLDIEVLETGSTGIFGLIRKKARIRVTVKEGTPAEKTVEQVDAEPETVVEPAEVSKEIDESESTDQKKVASEPKEVEVTVESPEPMEAVESPEPIEEEVEVAQQEENASPENLELVKTEVAKLVELMGYPSEVETRAEGLTVYCTIGGEFEEQLAGPEGKTLDSIQYLIRKMVARKCEDRLRIMINVGEFREKRLEELKVRAVELAQKVRETGKTHVLPALNPSERREIHMVLQEDKEIRSRSVGDGLFKKILIYKPGKSTRGGRRKNGNRGGRKPRGYKNTKNSGND